MRSIGKRNIQKVKDKTREVITKLQHHGQSLKASEVKVLVMIGLDSELWDIWEDADTEIKGIIWDTTMEMIL